MRKSLALLLCLALCLGIAGCGGGAAEPTGQGGTDTTGTTESAPRPTENVAVPVGAYDAKALAWAAEKGVTDGSFAPDGVCTRAEAITFLWRAAGSPAPAAGASPYADVPAGQFYTDAVLWAAEAGIIEAGGTFSPDEPCTRAMAADFLWKNAGSPEARAFPFTDVPESESYARAAAWAARRGFVAGDTFGPREPCSQGQVVTLLYWAVMPIPTDEYRRAVWYRFLPKDLEAADPDSATVTWAQFCAMLGRMIGLYDASKLPAWEELTAGAPDTAMKRDGAMIALTFAAEQLGLLQENFLDVAYIDSETYMENIGSYDWGADCTYDYPVFPWDTQCPFGFLEESHDYVFSDFFYFTRRSSCVSGLPISLGGNGDFRLDQPLTLRDAMLMTVRLYESDKEIAKDVKAQWDRLDYSPEYKQVLAEADALRESILNDASAPEIKGTTYYVSNSGDDANDGLTPETAWATPEKVSTTKLNPGDGVLFERGSVFRGPDKIDREGVFLECQPGVTYAAYGAGPKPVLMGSPESGADPAKWSLYGETPDGGKVWVFYRDMRDCGTIVLNDGDIWTRKVRPGWDGEKFFNEDGSEFDVLAGLDQDLTFFSPADSLLRQPPVGQNEWNAGAMVGITLYAKEYRNTVGKLYLRCDQGNPGEVFDSVEFGVCPSGAGSPLVGLTGGVTFSNIKVTCTSDCGFYGENGEEARLIQNCEISFCGGGLLAYDLDGSSGVAGDGINTMKEPHTISHCYIHDNNDNGVTIEWNDSEDNLTIHDMTVTGNLFERNGFGIQIVCFDEGPEDYDVVFRDFTVEDNFILDIAGGWSGDSHGFGGSCLTYGDNSDAPLHGENMVIRNNVMASFNSRALIYGACDGYDPPIIENNRLFVPPFYALVDDPEDNVAVILWTNETGIPEEGTGWLWLYAHNCDDFLNGYLGSGNTVQTVK